MKLDISFPLPEENHPITFTYSKDKVFIIFKTSNLFVFIFETEIIIYLKLIK